MDILKSFENLHFLVRGIDPEKIEVSEIFKNCILKSSNSEDFYKSWSSDLKQKFPNGDWRTVNGAKVFINNGKVVAGLDGFNGEIDKFFEERKVKKETEQTPKEKLADLKDQSKKLREKRDKEVEGLGDDYSRSEVRRKYEKELSDAGDQILKVTREIYADKETGKLDFAAIAKDSGNKEIETSLDGKDNMFGMQAQFAFKELASHINNATFEIGSKSMTWKEALKKGEEQRISFEDLESKLDLGRARRMFPSLDIKLEDGFLSISSKKGDGNMTLSLNRLIELSSLMEKRPSNSVKNVSASFNKEHALTDLIELKKKGVPVSQVAKDLEELKKFDGLKKDIDDAKKKVDDYAISAKDIKTDYYEALERYNKLNKYSSSAVKKETKDTYDQAKIEYNKFEAEERKLRNDLSAAQSKSKYRSATKHIFDKPEYRRVNSKGWSEGNHLENIADNMKKDVNLFTSTVDLLANKELREEGKTNKRGFTKKGEKTLKEYQKKFDNAYYDSEKVKMYEAVQGSLSSGKFTGEDVLIGEELLKVNKEEYDRIKNK